MEQALALAALGEGSASPNPRVGCVLVNDGRLVGRGFHRAPGEPHAEALAVAEAGAAARGATLYVNLEPCAHHGRTPPCADLLIESGVARVVAAMQDPNPLVDGRGFERLRSAGIEVQVGALGDEALRLNAAFVHWHRDGLPLVTLKAALSADGALAAAGGRSRWVSGTAARRFAHRLRLAHDAVLVGAGTVRADDPRLTVRLPGVVAPRRRVVISSRLDLDPASRLFDAHGPAVRVYTAADAPQSRAEPLVARGAEVVRLESGPHGLDLRQLLRDLAATGAQSVLVEGGGRTIAAFLAAGLAQRAALFVSGKLFGARGATPFINSAAARDPGAAARLVGRRVIPLGEDLLWLARVQTAEARAEPTGERCSPD